MRFPGRTPAGGVAALEPYIADMIGEYLPRSPINDRCAPRSAAGSRPGVRRVALTQAIAQARQRKIEVSADIRWRLIAIEDLERLGHQPERALELATLRCFCALR